MTRATDFAFWVVVLLACATAACSTVPDTAVKSTAPVCEALLGPIKYNSTNPQSRRHAGPDLAPDLAKHNRVGRLLRCHNFG